MAKVYSGIEGVKVPEYSSDIEQYKQATTDYENMLRSYCKENSNCKHSGEIISFPIADGRAQYMVFDYRTIFHLPFDDDYAIPEAHSRGLRKADIVKMIEANKSLSELFPAINR